MTCEYVNSCGFLEKTGKMDQFTVHTVMRCYCENDKGQCVRYCLTEILDEEDIPDYLWPNDEAEAQNVIEDVMEIRKRRGG